MMTDANQEWIDAQKELDTALAEQHQWQDRYTPVGVVEPGQPLPRGQSLDENAFVEADRIEKRVREAQERYNRAAEALRTSHRNN